VLAEFGDPLSSIDTLVRDVLRQLGSVRVGRSSSIDRVSVWRVLQRAAVARADRQGAFRRCAVAHARAELRCRGIIAPIDEADALLRYLMLAADQEEEDADAR